MRNAVLAAAINVIVMPVAAFADPVTGPYISLGSGYNIDQDSYLHTDTAVTGIPSGKYNGNGASTRFRWGDGFNSVGAVGYGLGNGLRLEIEGFYRYNNVDGRYGSPVPGTSSGHTESYGTFGNVFYDFDLNQFGIDAWGLTPYVGAGAGYQWSHLSPITTLNADGTTDRVGGTNGSFAWQGIVGVAYPMDYVLPGLDLTVEYRYIGALNNTAFRGRHYDTLGEDIGDVSLSQAANHSIMLGVRYALFQPPAPLPPAAPPAPPPPAPVAEPTRTYLVFFDWDRADLTERARQIVAQAAQASTQVKTTQLEVNGYTDLSGSTAYNQKLSVRRARAVEAELVRDGVADNEIGIHGYGESNPLVPTAKGVREPQNRRVEIIIH